MSSSRVNRLCLPIVFAALIVGVSASEELVSVMSTSATSERDGVTGFQAMAGSSKL